jgi:hypothetical protein
MTAQKTSDFYSACRNADLDTVKKILPKLKLNEINSIESNGSTALHAAAFYGHANIVHLLLQRGADTTIRNKYKKTAKEEASTDEIRAMFNSADKLTGTNNSNDDDDELPQSELVQLYQNNKSNDEDESLLASRIFKTRLSSYVAHKYTISATSNLEHLEEKYYTLCKESGKINELKEGEHLFRKYRQTQDFNIMIRFCTMDTPFCSMVRDNEAFLIEMYKHLLQYDKFNFQGCTYTNLQLSEKDFKLFQWAFTHPHSLLELRTFTETLMPRQSSLHYLQNLSRDSNYNGFVLFEFKFLERCFTAIDAQSFSIFKQEKEVYILSGTFFKVTDIREDNDGFTVISLVNVPVNKDVLSVIM